VIVWLIGLKVWITAFMSVLIAADGRVSCECQWSQVCRGYGDSHGYVYGMGIEIEVQSSPGCMWFIPAAVVYDDEDSWRVAFRQREPHQQQVQKPSRQRPAV